MTVLLEKEMMLWKRIRQSHALASAERLRFAPGPPAWSPTSEEVAFYWADDAELQVWRFNIGSARLSRLTAPPFAGAARQRTVMDRLFIDRPDWSPDGQRLVGIGRHQTEEQALYLIDMNGHLERLVGGPGVPRNPRWSPDGRRIVFVSYRDGKDDLWLVDPGTRHLWQLTWDRYDNTDPQWSPDGQAVVYTSQRSDVDPLCSQLCLLDLRDGACTPLPENPRSHSRFARWRDTHHVCFLSDRSGYDEVWEVDLRTGRTRMLTSPTGYDKGEFDVRPGAEILVVAIGQSTDRHLHSLALDSGRSRALVSGDGVILWPALSRTSHFVACWRSGPSLPPEIIVLDLKGSEVARTTTSPLSDRMSRVQTVGIPSSDGVKVDALLYTPYSIPSSPGAGVLWIHGGPNSQTLNTWEPFFHYLGELGVTILAPNCRGSTGYGRAFMDANLYDWGGGDARDWGSCLQYLAGLTHVDPNRLGVWGRSYGGYATLMALCLFPDLLRAGVCQFGPAELVSFFHETSVRHLMVRFMGLPVHRGDLYVDRSPLSRIESLRAPLLILQGDKDVAVPPMQAELVTSTLQRLDRLVEYACYENEGHGFDQAPHVLDAARRIEHFFRTYLGGVRDEPTPGG